MAMNKYEVKKYLRSLQSGSQGRQSFRESPFSSPIPASIKDRYINLPGDAPATASAVLPSAPAKTKGSSASLPRGSDAEVPLAPAVAQAEAPRTWREELTGLWSFFSGPINVLLVFVPLGAASYYLNWGPSYTFWLNFCALIPLANLIGNSTEELALHTGEIIGGLLNATFGNVVEMLISVQAIQQGLLQVVKSTLIGSVLSNLLLVLGMSFFAGGVKYKEQKFNVQGANSNTSLLLLAALSLALPTTFHFAPGVSSETVVQVSRISALIILSTYVMFVYFQLVTHIHLFTSSPAPSAPPTPTISNGNGTGATQQGIQMSGRTVGPIAEDPEGQEEEEEEEETPNVSAFTAAALLLTCSVVTAISSEFLVSSIELFTEEMKIGQAFIGVVLLPIVGNACEHWSAVTCAMKNKMDLSIGVAAGSATQISLFAIPLAILLGWCFDQPLSLDFEPLETTILFMSVLIVIGVVSDGKSNWLEGAMLMAAYVLVAVVFWYFPDPSEANAGVAGAVAATATAAVHHGKAAAAALATALIGA